MNNEWNKFNYESDQFERMDDIPKLTENFSGVGTRELNENGKEAIKKIYEISFGVEEEQQIRLPVTQEIAGSAPVNPANL